LPIAESTHGVKKMMIDKKNGKEAITDYRVVERFHGYTLMHVVLHTGRTHQIRVHLSAIGLPLLSDSLYGNGEWFFLSSIKRNYKSDGKEKPLLARTALHAFSLSFIQPLIGQNLFFEAPLAKDMEMVLKVLKKYEGR
jgi:23S rRNA pseudouridine955/2504/2580 synthase/23S rRNA pseudouridine1911/1915/1917 synthase